MNLSFIRSIYLLKQIFRFLMEQITISTIFVFMCLNANCIKLKLKPILNPVIYHCFETKNKNKTFLALMIMVNLQKILPLTNISPIK